MTRHDELQRHFSDVLSTLGREWVKANGGRQDGWGVATEYQIDGFRRWVDVSYRIDDPGQELLVEIKSNYSDLASNFHRQLLDYNHYGEQSDRDVRVALLIDKTLLWENPPTFIKKVLSFNSDLIYCDENWNYHYYAKGQLLRDFCGLFYSKDIEIHNVSELGGQKPEVSPP